MSDTTPDNAPAENPTSKELAEGIADWVYVISVGVLQGDSTRLAQENLAKCLEALIEKKIAEMVPAVCLNAM